MVSDLTSSYFVIGERKDFSMMNFIVSQPFYNNHFELSVGVKNIFDVSSVRDTTIGGTAHNAADSAANLFYGRSYFARLNYNF